ncbi:MAG: L-histidine N(alpha)-methyltransferase [Acidobacteriales bacterium]|nr:L-histidine N(alpha)-methyltransferase [Terriglobales bacterium]
MIALQRPVVPEIALDVIEGLTSRPKSLPPKLFYDAEGSAIFEEITRLPEYYLTRTELGILQERAGEICRHCEPGVSLVELGAGSGHKTRTIIASLLRRQLWLNYFPVDVSAAALQSAKAALEAEFEYLSVRPIVMDYSESMRFLRRIPRPRLVLYIGSSIGNLEPRQAAFLLRQLRAQLEPGDCFLLGTDLVKERAILLPAYDDADGVTAAFNKNVLARINRELGGHFDLALFKHVASWNESESRMEMYLESRAEQVVRIDALNLSVPFAKGERIHTENSYKYRVEDVRFMLTEAGFELAHTWYDERKWFAVHLARAA